MIHRSTYGFIVVNIDIRLLVVTNWSGGETNGKEPWLCEYDSD